ncbi:hypothetical protein N9383_00525 [Granulosicoccus sp.]|nr:hypothetical protein [Granulosicoccus sp.]
MKKTIGLPLAVFTLTMTLAGCGDNTEQASDTTANNSDQSENGGVIELAESSDTTSAPVVTENIENIEKTEWTESEEINQPLVDELNNAASLVEVMDDDSVPYPVYPNGLKYRVGGENGMKIVLYQTEDSFEEVDAYYQAQADKRTGMPRLTAMNDYVRYSADDADVDPWETSKPGIVIHKFNNESEREAVGASEKANTNIIMSFK